MKIGIMQPYLFPYLGYWQLINAVDKFVILDDVNFIKRGYINRNHILLNNSETLFTLPLVKASQNKLINETDIFNDEKEIDKLLLMIKTAYKDAPYFNAVYPLIDKIVKFKDVNLSKYITNSIIEICKYVGINTQIIPSSGRYEKKDLKGQLRILDIVGKESGKTYINPIGGLNLYEKEVFSKKGIQLKFIEMDRISYQQINNRFVSNLSIIDVLMFNSQKEIVQLLEKYKLV